MKRKCGNEKWGQRPEDTGAPDEHYVQEEAARYTATGQTIKIQKELTQRAIDLVHITDPYPVLIDIGCGSGLSSGILTSQGIPWVGTDISLPMLKLAAATPLCSGRVLASNMGQGLPLRAEIFDAAISISALQWLCVAEYPKIAIKCLMVDLWQCLKPGARAALQVYVQDDAQASLLLNGALQKGFTGGFFMDLPHATPAKKFFLLLKKPDSGNLPKTAELGKGFGSGREVSGDEGGVLLPQHSCALAWPSTACCVLPWIHHVLSTSSTSSKNKSGSLTTTEAEAEDKTALGSIKARLTHEHAHLGKRALRLLRRCVNGGPMPATSTTTTATTSAATASNANTTTNKNEGKTGQDKKDEDNSVISMIEAAAVHRGLVPCSGAFAVHYWPRGICSTTNTTIEVPPTHTVQDDSAAAIQAAIQPLIGEDATIVLKNSEVRSVSHYFKESPSKEFFKESSIGSSFGRDSMTWAGSIKQAQLNTKGPGGGGDGQEQQCGEEQGKKKDAFYSLEHLSLPVQDSNSSFNSMNFMFSTDCAILHARKMPQFLVVCSQHATVSDLQQARGHMGAFCAAHNASVVGVDVVDVVVGENTNGGSDTKVGGLSCAWVLYVSGLAGRGRGVIVEWITELHLNSTNSLC